MSLRQWNTTLGVVHLGILVGIVIMLVYLYDVDNALPTTTYVTSTFQRGPSADVEVVTRVVGTGSPWLIPGLLVGFSAWTCAAHFGYAFFDDVYTRVCDNKNNWLRWVEYAVSATLIMLVIALSSGVSDHNALVVVAVLCVGVMLLGQVAEANLYNDDQTTSYLATAVGWLLLASMWSFVWVQFGEAQRTVKARNALVPKAEAVEIPSFVLILLILMTGAFASFGVVQFVQLVQANEDVYETYDKTYMILSATAKTILPVVFAVGLTQRSRLTTDILDGRNPQLNPPKRQLVTDDISHDDTQPDTLRGDDRGGGLVVDSGDIGCDPSPCHASGDRTAQGPPSHTRRGVRQPLPRGRAVLRSHVGTCP